MRNMRKVLSIVLALAMILTMAPISVGSFAANAISVDEETIDINTAQSDELIRPNATVEVTPVTRACFSLSNPLKEASGSNSVITAATLSGIAKNTYNYSGALYAGEVPVSTTIRFTPGADIDTSTLGITCSNSSVEFVGPTSPSAGVYEWTIKDGAPVAVGEVLTFSVTYKYVYTDTASGKTYNSDKTFTTTGYSYVESVLSPAGIYSHYRTYISYVVASKNVNRSYVASYLLGAGVYSTSSTTGAFDPNNGNATDSSDYGKLLYSSESGTDKYANFGFGADGNRPLSVVYYDVSRGNTLAAQNVRFAAMMPKRGNQNGESDGDQNTNLKVEATYEYTDVIQTYDKKNSEGRKVSNSNTTDLGLVAPSTELNAVGQYLTVPFTGSGPAGADGQNHIYTMILDFNTPGYWAGVYTRHSHTIGLIKVDKGALRAKLQSVVNSDVSGPLVTDDNSGKGYNPQSWYYTGGGWGEYSAAYAEAQRICDKPNATADEITTALRNLTNTYDNLVLAGADYTEIDFYYNTAMSLNESDYQPQTWAALETALAEYESGYSILYQPKLDKICKDIKTAYNNLRLADADYTAVDKVVDTVNGTISDIYYEYGLTPSQYYTNWSILETALDNCGYYYDETSEAYVLDPEKTKSRQEQAIVDGFPLTLQTAINQLTVRTADYTDTRTALSAYSAFKTSTAPYITDASLAAIESAYSALYALYSPAKSIEYQNDIDDAVAALNDALNNYEYKDADYTAANQAKQSYQNLDRSIYQDLTAVDQAYQALVALDGLDARSQSQIDTATRNLNTAISKLQKKSADYTAVNNAVAAANAEDARISGLYPNLTAATFYTNWLAVQNAINAVNWNLDGTQQATVDGYATAINAALAALTEKDADYTALNNAVADAYNYLDDAVAAKYTDESIDALFDAVLGVTYGKKISEQSVVDGYTAAIIEAIGNLELLKADYTLVTTAIANANAKKTQSEQFAAAHHGYPYYTAASIANLDSKINAVVYNLDISKQNQVNNYATAINTAASVLVVAPADYTDVETAKASVPADLSVYTDASKAALTQALAYNKNLKANSQATVDGFDDDIYAAIAALKYKPISTTGYYSTKATIPANLSVYTDESVAAVNNQISAIDTFLAGTVDIRDQASLDAMVAVLAEKIGALELKPTDADYTAVEAAKAAAATALASDEAQYYTDASKQAVTDAVNAVVYGLLETEQTRVDGFATAINNAVNALAYKPIDRTAFDAAVAAFDAIENINNYTDASVQNVRDVIAEGNNLLTGDVNIKDQASLDEITSSVYAAIDALALNGADYTAVNAAIAAANDLDKDLYVDFSGVDTAIAAVQRGLTVDKQSTVDGFAAAINNAVAALQFKPIDTAAYVAAKATIPADLTVYTDASVAAVNDQITAIDAFLADDVDIRDQAALNSMVTTLNQKINALAKKGADYTALNAVIDEFLDLDEDLYTNYEDAYDVYYAVKSWKSKNGGLKIDQQGLVDEQTALLRNAIDALQIKPIDTAAYVAAKGTIPADLTIYTDASVAAVNDQIDAIDTFLAGDVDINDQAALDSMVAILNNKINALALKNADYTALNAVINEFLDVDETLYSNYEDAYDVYYAVKSWKSKNGNLKIDKQALIDEQTALLRAAIDSLLPIAPPEPAEYFQAKEGSTTVIKDGKIYGLKTSLTEKQMKENFIDTNVVDVTYTKAVKSAKFLGTGSTVTVKYKDGTVEEYVIIIYGDLDGNGLINYADVSLINLAVAESDTLDANQTFAADIDGRRRVTASDAANLNVAAQGSGLNQVKPSLPVEE